MEGPADDDAAGRVVRVHQGSRGAGEHAFGHGSPAEQRVRAEQRAQSRDRLGLS